jgi:4-hydroxy-tetrahydrodipicolinate synthase
VRKYVFQRRGIFSSDAQRKPSQGLTAMAKAEVDFLLSRLARVDKRAELKA